MIKKRQCCQLEECVTKRRTLCLFSSSCRDRTNSEIISKFRNISDKVMWLSIMSGSQIGNHEVSVFLWVIDRVINDKKKVLSACLSSDSFDEQRDSWVRMCVGEETPLKQIQGRDISCLSYPFPRQCDKFRSLFKVYLVTCSC